MPEDLTGHVALITGASRGIGRATAIALASAGCPVALMARSRDALAETARACRAEGVEALVLAVDVTDRAALSEAVDQVVAELGGLSILVNNAGVMARGPAQDADLDAFEHVIDVNVKAVMNLTRLALPHVIASDAGAVITIASVVSRLSFAGGGAYCASKHAVLGYSNSVFEDVREHGVKVSAIMPGFVDTDMVAGLGLRTERMIQPDDVARAVVFVARYPATGCPTEILIQPQRTPYPEAP